ncbi:DNA processing protein DprA [Arenicella chitinivorans]|uniref:DNA processing protein DprA n=1 Tax=Arenicella chitinivorans TaxID=1329800 RepID=A0A918S0Y7_9GAMM|nr:DNA-processing protein DprA [Arenicella chitinivorans]GHA20045.1 DNA processing protein DprA [Arenicella chitinivorans]
MVENQGTQIDQGAGDLRSWIALIHDTRWTRQQKYALLDHFKCPATVLQLNPSQQNAVLKGLKVRPRRSIDRDVARDLQWLAQPEHDLISLQDERYPDNLKHIADPPLALYAKGDIDLLTQPCIAMVGSRRPTPLGQQITRRLAAELAELGLVIVSGMAYGVDGLAHESVLTTEGATVAVLGSGLGKPSPARHEGMFARIASTGLVLSEYPVDQHATRYSFPERNRIISGLSAGVIVIEAAERSGTLITARLAVEQDREVLVVPGSILSPQYSGSHCLIQQGAALVQSANDILQVLGWESGAITSDSSGLQVLQNIPPECVALLQYISAEETAVDTLILATGLTPGEVSSMLMTLELAGAVAHGSSGGYINITH